MHSFEIGHSVSYWGCLTLRNLDARGPSQEGARRPGRRPAGHSGAGLYGCGLPDRMFGLVPAERVRSFLETFILNLVKTSDCIALLRMKHFAIP